MSKSEFKIDELALVLIVAVMAMIAGIYNKINETSVMEAEKIAETLLDDHPASFANNGIIDENKLNEIQDMDYKEFKAFIKAKNDFCIYIEDENGRIITAKGADKFNEDGMACRN